MVLEQKMRDELGLSDGDFGYYETDLHVVKTKETTEWLRKNYEFFENVTMFFCFDEGRWYHDVPFAGNWKTSEESS